MTGDKYDNIDPEILKKAQDRGTCVHSQLETDDRRCICEKRIIAHVQMADGMRRVRKLLIKKLNISNPKIGREVTVFNADLIGQIDLLIEGDKKMVVVDYKTTRDEHLKSWKIQLVLYG
jgi:ATP-dependent exoDNAse (exonuclease V) beta subunit